MYSPPSPIFSPRSDFWDRGPHFFLCFRGQMAAEFASSAWVSQPCCWSVMRISFFPRCMYAVLSHCLGFALASTESAAWEDTNHGQEWLCELTLAFLGHLSSSFPVLCPFGSLDLRIRAGKRPIPPPWLMPLPCSGCPTSPRKWDSEECQGMLPRLHLSLWHFQDAVNCCFPDMSFDAYRSEIIKCGKVLPLCLCQQPLCSDSRVSTGVQESTAGKACFTLWA